MAAVNKRAAWRIALEDVKSGMELRDALNKMLESYTTVQSKNWSVARLKSELRLANNAEAVKQITDSKLVADIIENSNIEQENRRLVKSEEPFYVNPIFNRSAVIERLKGYLSAGIEHRYTDLPFFCDMLICFAARPHEIFNLKISDSGYVTGHGKNPGNFARKFLGLLDTESCKKLLTLLKGRYDRSALYLQVDKKYDMKLSQFRKLGAMYITSHETNMGKKRIMLQQALRHKTPATSLMYYDIKQISHDPKDKMKQTHKKVSGGEYSSSSDSG